LATLRPAGHFDPAEIFRINLTGINAKGPVSDAPANDPEPIELL